MPDVKSKAQLGLMLSKNSPLSSTQKESFKGEIKGKSFKGLPEHVESKESKAHEKKEESVVKKYPPRSQAKVRGRMERLEGGK